MLLKREVGIALLLGAMFIVGSYIIKVLCIAILILLGLYFTLKDLLTKD